MRETGRSYANIQVELNDGRVFTIYKKYNHFAFDLHIFPEPSEIYAKAQKDGTLTRIEGKYPKEYTKRKAFSGELTPIESVSYWYQVRIQDIMEDIEAGIFPKGAVSKKNGRIFINSLVAWKYYGKGEQVNG